VACGSGASPPAPPPATRIRAVLTWWSWARSLYSPNLNLIERLWRFIKRRALYGRYQPTFAQFQAAIQEVLDGLSTTHAEKLKSLMTLKFQRFEDVSLMAA